MNATLSQSFQKDRKEDATAKLSVLFVECHDPGHTGWQAYMLYSNVRLSASSKTWSAPVTITLTKTDAPLS